MLSKIKKFIIDKIRDLIYIEISENLEKYLKLQNLKELETLRNLNFCKINTQFSVGSGFKMNFEGTPDIIEIQDNVCCKNYCNFLIYNEASLSIGDNVFINNFSSINCLYDINIGANTMLGESVKIYDHDHKHYQSEGKLIIDRNEFTFGKVSIGRNCWIGSNVTILKGVIIGDNCIIGANNLIYKSVPANSVVKANTSYTISA
ncbi:MAG: acyltransferase [Opitutaceae bacterium]|nr:acyltransferase [Cytophagales bacterium]